MCSTYSSHNKSFSLELIDQFSNAFMLFGRTLSSEETLTPEEETAAKENSKSLARRFGHLICEPARPSAGVISPEMLPLAQVGRQQLERVGEMSLRLESWFSENSCSQLAAFESFCYWLVVACFTSDDVRQAHLDLLNKAEVGISSADTFFLVENLAKCYHLQAHLAYFTATLAYNRAKLEKQEKVLLESLSAAQGVLVCPQTNTKQAHSHVAFGSFMQYAHWFYKFNIVDQAKPQQCYLCGIGGKATSGKGRVPAVHLCDPREGLPADSPTEVYLPTCQPCLHLFQAWWYVYHFLDVVVPKHLEEFLKDYLPTATPAGSGVRAIAKKFFTAKHRELLNILNPSRDLLFNTLSCYFVHSPSVEVVAASFEGMDIFAKFLGKHHAAELEKTLHAILDRGSQLIQSSNETSAPAAPRSVPQVTAMDIGATDEQTQNTESKLKTRKRRRPKILETIPNKKATISQPNFDEELTTTSPASTPS